MAQPRAPSPRPQLGEVSVPRLGLNRGRAVVLAVAALMLSACASAATAPPFTFAPVSSPSAAAAQTACRRPRRPPQPTSAPTSQPTAAPSSGSSAGPIGVPPQGTAIYVSEWSVGLPTSMLAGQVNFSITNIGTIQHELLVFKSDLAPSAFPVDSKGNIIEDGPGITLVSRGDKIDPGKTQARTVDLTQPGTYTLRLQHPGPLQDGHVQGRHRDVPLRGTGLHPGCVERVARRRAYHDQGRHGQPRGRELRDHPARAAGLQERPRSF